MKYLKRIKDLRADEASVTGGKAANLGEMTQNNLNVPGGFCVTGPALDYLIEENNMMPKIREILDTMDYDNYDDIEDKSADIRKMIIEAPIPSDLETEMKQQITELRENNGGEDPFVAVRSSVSVKDSDITSFPGMMDTYHFIKGEKEIFYNVRECWASLFTARAVHRRHQQNIPQDKGVIAPVVQRMVNSDVAGVLFTANPITSNRKEIVIEANWGLGESLVSGAAIVDYFIVGRGENDELSVKMRKIMDKNIIVTIDKEKGIGRKQYDLDEERSKASTLNDEQLIELAELGLTVENIFGVPQDVEWAYENGELYLLQARKIKGLK
ncbi:MAG: PEP/pyruvate-binding domain-containing protein [Spirochaetota bacterium]